MPIGRKNICAGIFRTQNSRLLAKYKNAWSERPATETEHDMKGERV
jgi:hypothetical protein